MQTKPTIIDVQYASGKALVDYLKEKKELSLLSKAEEDFKKNLLLSAASYFESEICSLITDATRLHSNNNDIIISFVSNKAIKRQYHTYFSWENKNNANSFFGLFGEKFKSEMTSLINKDEKLKAAISAFLTIGDERNKLVHKNFASAIIDKTADEIYELFKSALLFLTTLSIELKK